MPKTIGDALEWHARFTPNKQAVVEANALSTAPVTTLTYGQLWMRACALANGMRSLGVGPGDRIAILMLNSARYMEVYHAIALIGCAAVPLNFRFIAAEIDYIVNHSKAKALFLDAAFEPVVRGMRERLPSLGIILISTDARAPGCVDYEDLLAKSPATSPNVDVDRDECFFQGYTAGTTGSPKGCVDLHGAFVDFFKRVALYYGVGPNDVELVPAPLFHAAPTLFALLQIFRGGTVVVTRESQPEALLRLIAEFKITWAFMVPTMWDSIVSAKEVRSSHRSSMRLLLSAGAPLLTHTKNAMLKYFPDASLNEYYGATEVGIVTNLCGEDQHRKVRSVGTPIPGFAVRLVDDDGRDVAQGEVGEIYIRGPMLMREYFMNPEATAAARHGDWFSVGDMGRFDEEGYLYIVDRKKDMIITGGENVYPAEIEAVLYQHPAVAMTAVVGIPDPKWGEIIYAAVVLKNGEAASESILADHCAQHLARFKIPKKFAFVDRLPTSSFGKILRREVRRPFWEREDAAV
ncbi:MAG: long-chain-fatty-acid--CoA ligase [Bradyrhizobium sp.]|uniref:long-chain-fatty-acid--CoA ligase n=1 Tax=Bradyrhizobium sp. TaxID=376 RepID=UPI003D0D5E35